MYNRVDAAENLGSERNKKACSPRITVSTCFVLVNPQLVDRNDTIIIQRIAYVNQPLPHADFDNL